VTTFSYDAVNQLLSGVVTNGGALVNTFAYAYDSAGNRLLEQIGASNNATAFNALNQIVITTVPGTLRTNEWDAADRLAAVNSGNQRTELAYDGLGRVVEIRQLINGSEVSHRRLVWCGNQICAELDAAGAVTKRFYGQGMAVETGPSAGHYYYTRDHLGSIRELTDAGGNVRARYTYDPYGRRTKLAGDLDADFGFAGMFWSGETSLLLTRFRAYDPELGRWLSRDPLKNAETREGPNLYAYVRNEPVNHRDPQGLTGTLPGLGFNTVSTTLMAACAAKTEECAAIAEAVAAGSELALNLEQNVGGAIAAAEPAAIACADSAPLIDTLPGVFPDTINVAANAAANAAAEVSEAVPELEEVVEGGAGWIEEVEEINEWSGSSADWFAQTVQANGAYLDSLGLGAERSEFLRRLATFSLELFKK
jgi:RHS repeat-associated protein